MILLSAKLLADIANTFLIISLCIFFILWFNIRGLIAKIRGKTK